MRFSVLLCRFLLTDRDIIREARARYLNIDRTKEAEQAIDSLISQFWYCSNLKEYQEDSQKPRKQVKFVNDEMILMYKELHQNCFVLEDYNEDKSESIKNDPSLDDINMTRANDPLEEEEGERRNERFSFDQLFEEQQKLDNNPVSRSLTPLIESFRPMDSLRDLGNQVEKEKLESWKEPYHKVSKKLQIKTIHNQHRKTFCKLSAIQDKSLHHVFDSSTEKIICLRQILVNCLFLNNLNCLIKQSNLPDEFKVI